MSDTHITREMLQAVAQGVMTPRALLEMGWRHLTNLCPHCREEALAWKREREKPLPDATASAALPLVLERHNADWEEKRQRAERDLRELLSLSQEARLSRISRAQTRFRGPVLSSLLLTESKRTTPESATRSYELAECAVAVLRHTPHGPTLPGLRARATAYMANASRRLDDYQAAHRLFALSRSILQSEGVTDLLVYAEIDSAEAVLHLDQRRFREAEELLNQSVVLYSVAGARELSVHPLITLGLLEYTRGDFMKAIEATEFAAEFLDPERDLQLFVCARFNLALFLFESGQFRAATDALGAARKTIEQLPDTYTRLRIIWLEAKIAAALQRFEEAESALRIARDGFVEQRNGYDAALASLDLALLLMRQGRTDEVRQIAEEILPIFVTDEVDREALATLTLLADAAQQTTLAIELVEELIGRVERLRPSRSRCL